MRPHSSPDSSEQSSVLTIGVTDLMTSLAVILFSCSARMSQGFGNRGADESVGA